MSLTHTANDVLIVGAGPIGLALANELIRHGVGCRIIDSAPLRFEQKSEVASGLADESVVLRLERIHP